MSFRTTLRRAFDSRLVGSGLLPLCLVGLAGLGGAAPAWQRHAQLPVPRTEVAAARHGSELVVVGGYLPWGETTAQADAYSPAADRWRRLPALPQPVNHAAAATWRGRIYVAGGYVARGRPSNRAFVLQGAGWRELRRMPAGRAAAGAAVVGDTLVVAGGVGPSGLARGAYAFDLVRERWRPIAGPTPREHLAVTAAGGRVWALAGRKAGLDTNLRVVESWRPGARRWLRAPNVPGARGGTGAAAVGRTIVSIGGETPRGTIATVFAFDVRTRRWRRLPPLPTPRHGLGVVAFNGRVYALAGGPQPGLTTSGAVESLALR